MNTLKIEYKEKYAIVGLDRGKANAINQEMVTEIRQVFAELRQNKDVRGVILAGKEHFFSAGLDVIELYGYDKTQIHAFWQNFAEMVAEMTAFPKPLIAAITGYSPAGGCVLAVCADYRIMATGKYHIGLNEVPVGIVVPRSIFELYAFWIGKRRAYQNLLEGKLMSAEEALQIGLVDELASPEAVLQAAEAKLKQYLGFELAGWQKSKANLRKELLDSMQNFEESMAKTIEHWWSPQARAVLEKVIQQIRK